MLKTPCEYMQWQGLPIIRRELVKSMIKMHGTSQKEVAELLGLSPAAISQYLSKKRAKITIVNNDIIIEINISAEKIIKNGQKVVPNEICRICSILRKNGLMSFSAIE